MGPATSSGFSICPGKAPDTFGQRSSCCVLPGTISHPRSQPEAAVCKSLPSTAGGPGHPCRRVWPPGGVELERVFAGRVFSVSLRGMFAFRSLETKGSQNLAKVSFIPFCRSFYQGERECAALIFFLLKLSQILLAHKDLGRNTCSVLKSKVSTS